MSSVIEHFFCKLKQFRAIATRYDKTARTFLAAVYLAGTAIRLNEDTPSRDMLAATSRLRRAILR